MRQNQIYITPFSQKNKFYAKFNIDSAVRFKFDFSSWSEEYSDISSIEFVSMLGSISVTDTTVTDNVCEPLLTFSQSGINILSFTATSVNSEKYVGFLELYIYDAQNDYADNLSYYY